MMTITADHLRFYRGTERMAPVILHEKIPLDHPGDAACVVLPARPESDLKWQEALIRAQACLASGKLIVWHFDFGLEEIKEPSYDETLLLSCSVAIDLFVNQIWPMFHEHTLGVCLYQGVVGHLRAEGVEFDDWLKESSIDTPCVEHEQIFTCEALSWFLHRLVAFFPETAIVFACFDLEPCRSIGLQALMVSKLRLDHLHLCLKGVSTPLSRLKWGQWALSGDLDAPEPQVAVCIPEEVNGLWSLDALLLEVQRNDMSGAFRLIAERRLTEEWDGINTLIVISSQITPSLERKLKGFAAAGGEVVVWEEKS